jgi:hypothetical protein
MSLENKKKILKNSKRVLPKDRYKKLKSIFDEEDFVESARYYMKIFLEKEIDSLETDVLKSKKKGEDVFFAELNLKILKSKIKAFLTTLLQEDLNKVFHLIKRIKKEIKNG